MLDGLRGRVVAGGPMALKRTPLAIAFGPPQRQAEGETAQHVAERLERLAYGLAAEADAARGGPVG
ncbi:MAG TPA: hypothetical protein VGE94_06155 [Chloroflexota bacterium]